MTRDDNAQWVGPSDSDRTWAEVDLAAVRHNVGEVRRIVGPNVAVAAVVKANGYGHGAAGVARASLDGGAVTLVVANVAEAVELREAGLQAPIIIIGASLCADAEAIVTHDLEASLSPPEMLDAILAEARRQGKRPKVHIMTDLGMRRVGVNWDEAMALARRLREAPEVEFAGLASHFPTADASDTSFSEQMIAEFGKLVVEIEALGLKPGIAHLASTPGLLRFRHAHFDMVRAGIVLYGMSAAPTVDGMADWRPALAWRARVVYVRRVAAGTAVGYGHTYVTPADTVMATLPVGYYDGYPRSHSNNGEVLVRGQRAPVVGRVSMDYITVDVGHIPGVAVGDVATLVGADGDECIRAEDVAEQRGTIPHEVTCAIGRRVRRVYVDSGQGAAAGQLRC